ncbi:MAG: nucleotide pyrophosphohydrolase [Pseudomonadota bacterium]|jgi:NTP pyrophosphatase (non-canonical NTP hydrolase)
MSDLAELQKRMVEFRDARNWAQFHNAKDLAVCLSIEAAELLELFLWKQPKEASKERVSEELADVLGALLLIAKEYDIDLFQAMIDKIAKNEVKYPVEKSRGSNKKYSEL